MSTTHRIATWIDTGTGRQAAGEISVEVASGSIVGDAASMAGSAIEVRSEAAALVVNDLVYVSGWSETHALPLVTKADANAAGRQAQFVMRGALAQNANGMAYTAFRTAADVNTNAVTTAGDPVYLSETAGGWTETAPTAATSTVQIVGHCAIKSATVGVIEFDLRDFPTINTNDLQDLAVTAGKIANSTITTTQISGTAAITGAQLAAGADIAGTQLAAAAAIARTQLATDTILIDLEEKLKAADGADLALSETADDFFRNVGTNQWLIDGEATVNETELSSGLFSFLLPENYVAGGTISLRASALVVLAGDAVNDATSTIDMQARKVTKTTGAIGADLVSTAATTLATAGADYNFVVDPTGLVAGDKLVCKLATSMVETAGGTGAANSRITALVAVIQAKG